MILRLLILIIVLNLTGVSSAAQAPAPKGKTKLFIGQDRETIRQYLAATGEVPYGFMIYSSVQAMNGLEAPVDYGAGIIDAQALADRYPDAAFQIGLYMVDGLQDVVKGTYDKHLHKLAEWIKRNKRPVYLRIGYEFDLPDNHYDPGQYVEAFRHIVDYLRKEGVPKTYFVWHSYGYMNPDRPMMSWYPGDDYVDYFGVSFFKAFNAGNMKFILNRAAEHHKPFMIAEATPFGVGTLKGRVSWNLWFKPFFQFIDEHDIPVVSYINSDWESQPMFKGKGWGDARIQANDIVKTLWIEKIRSPRFK